VPRFFFFVVLLDELVFVAPSNPDNFQWKTLFQARQKAKIDHFSPKMTPNFPISPRPILSGSSRKNRVSADILRPKVPQSATLRGVHHTKKTVQAFVLLGVIKFSTCNDKPLAIKSS
jgi:hypothetical protein